MKLFTYLNKFRTSISTLILVGFLWSCGGGSGGDSAKDENLSAAYSDNGTIFKITVSSSGYSNKYYVDGIETKSLRFNFKNTCIIVFRLMHFVYFALVTTMTGRCIYSK